MLFLSDDPIVVNVSIEIASLQVDTGDMVRDTEFIARRDGRNKFLTFTSRKKNIFKRKNVHKRAVENMQSSVFYR